MDNIFTDGKIVHTFAIPEEVREDLYEKSKWGVTVLGDYIVQFHGSGSRRLVQPSESYEGKLTGTIAVIKNSNKRITYMMVEPQTQKNPKQPEVHISKMVEDLNQGRELDYLMHEFSKEGHEARNKALNSPFAQLGGIRKNLPKKKKKGVINKIFRR